MDLDRVLDDALEIAYKAPGTESEQRSEALEAVQEKYLLSDEQTDTISVLLYRELPQYIEGR